MSRRPWVIAHRGASAVAPESTRAALREAISAGVEMVELDVQLTRDMRLVVFHDIRLDRTTDGCGPLARTPYRQLARLDAGLWFSPRFVRERVLLASQALRILRRTRTNLELKRTPHKALLVDRVLRCLRATRAGARVLVSSFDPSLIAIVHRRRPRLATALICHREYPETVRRAVRLGCLAIHPHVALATPTRIRQAHAAGLRVHVWTVDEPRLVRRLAHWGVDGLFSNDPRRTAAVLRGGAPTRRA